MPTDAGDKTALDPVKQPILNPPYSKPDRHWYLDPVTFRATDQLICGRRLSGDYMQVPKDKKGLSLIEANTNTQIEPHISINAIRELVGDWRDAGWPGAKSATVQLLDHWTAGHCTERPFYCQVEAIETVIWLLEAGRRNKRQDWAEYVAKLINAGRKPRYVRHKDWVECATKLTETNAKYNDGIPRMALKLATGTGKTKLMQMLLTWLAVTQRGRVDILVLVPGLTVKDRLQELVPSTHPEIYDDLVPQHLRDKVNQARVTILNYHAFHRQNRLAVDGPNDKLTHIGKRLITSGGEPLEKWKETEEQMLNRLLALHGQRKLFVFNDEAHHCYRPADKVVGSADSEDRQFEADAALWFNALKALSEQKRLEHAFDLSATPMFLRRPADLKSVIFPWTVSDYPLVDAVEAGLTKIPRVPTDDDAEGKTTHYRNLYANTKQKEIKIDDMQESITSLLEQIHENYCKIEPLYSEQGKKPVMIVVANTVKNATALYHHIAGFKDGDGFWQAGSYDSFSNVERDGSGPKKKPPTVLVHSALDQEEEMSDTLAAALTYQAEIHTPNAKNKKERLKRIREIFNTVGRKGEPGENIRCVISVSMLTEGWDTRSVTHIFGFRKFGTQLLCEQVAGRGLRKTNFEIDSEDGLLKPEFVNIFGVPFNFMRGGGEAQLIEQIQAYKVHSVEGRKKDFRISFPNIVNYRIKDPSQQIVLKPHKIRSYDASSKIIPTINEIMGVLGESHISELTEKRRKHIIYRLAAKVVDLFSRNVENARKLQLFGSAVKAVEGWLSHPLLASTDLRQLIVPPHSTNVPNEIVKCCMLEDNKELRIEPVFADQRNRSSPRCFDTGNVLFMTTKRLHHDTIHSELNRAPCDSGSEVLVAEQLDCMDSIAAWVRNYRLGWTIPYLDKQRGVWRQYEPDFIARLRHPNGQGEPVHLVIEYKGQPGPDSDAKTDGVMSWWIPAVSRSDDPCCHGEWRYVFIDSESQIMPVLQSVSERQN